VIVSVRQAPPLAHATVPCYEEVFVIHIGVSARVRHSSARPATSSRQKSGMSGTTRPQTRWEAAKKRRNTSPMRFLDNHEWRLSADKCTLLVYSRVWCRRP
jgi:hypothetical protein